MVYKIWGNLASAFYQIPEDRFKSDIYFDQAIKLGEKDLKLNPRDASTLSSLASYYSMKGDRKNAIKYFDKALKLSPNDVDIIERGIETNEILGYRNEALKLVEKILEKGYPVSKLEKSPDLKNLIKDKRFEFLKKKFTNSTN